MSSIEDILSKKIEPSLAKDLIETYSDVNKFYFAEDYETVLSKTGKFVENVFRILNYIVTKKKLDEIKSGQIDEIIEKLRTASSEKYSETVRLIIPQLAKTVYTMRSKLGGEHVKPTKPDFLDSKLVASSCDWIVAALLRELHVKDPSQVDILIQKVKSVHTPSLSSFEVQLASQIYEISIPELIIVLLRTKSNQSKDDLIQTSKHLGRNIKSWFDGGNFTKRLINAGFIEKTGKNNSDDVFSLTIRGQIKAEILIEKLKSIHES